MDIKQLALELHKKYGGKIRIELRDPEKFTKQKLSAYYTPGVGEVCRAIAAEPAKLPDYTWTNNLVAVVSDGSAVLGLGDIGPEGAMPVMEGKSMLFKHFAGIDSVPIILDVHSADEIVAAVRAIAPSFGAINLEDIAAPKCFQIEEQLKSSLSIPVMHDDQHATAVITLAGLINACKVTGRTLADSRIVLVGAGAAGVAIAKLIRIYAGSAIIAVDSKGIISRDRTDLNESKQRLLEFTNQQNIVGDLADAVRGADIFIGVSSAGVLSQDMVRSMATDPIVFACANPDPEILPEDARAAGAAVVATGRSDYPNQVNNVLVFPGIFRGALTNHVQQITDEHKIAAAEALAALVENPTANEIVPSVFDERVVPAVAAVVK